MRTDPRRRPRAAAVTTVASLIGAGLAFGAPNAAAAAIPEDSLILHYEFETDQIAAGTVTDLSPRGLDGTIVNAASSAVVDGRSAGTKALELPGGPTSSTTAAYVSIPNGLFEGASAMTISAWVRWDGGPDFQWVYGLGKNQNASVFYTPSFQGDAKARSSIKPVNGSAEVGVSGPAKLPSGSWQNVVTTIDGQSISYYLNGLKVGSKPAALDLAATMHSGSNATSGFLGKPFWSGHPYFDGALDDVRVYDVAFTDAQVAQLSATDDATIDSLATDRVEVSGTVGTEPELPYAVAAVYSDGATRAAVVNWDAIDPSSYATRGTFTVEGTIEGYDGTVTAAVTMRYPSEFMVDLSTDTGAFHGGASGTLYGVYGEDLPSRNLLEGINLRTVATKAQDGPQHPGADALEVVKAVADSSDGDVYIYMTDIHRGFPYQWEGDTPEEKLDIYMGKLDTQVDQVLELPEKYRDNIVFMPYNEPEGNMFGTGQWSYNKVHWHSDPSYFFAAWDRAYELIKGKMPDARISGPNTSTLYAQNKGFLQHAVDAGTVPDVFAWHELSNPATIRSSVDRYRGWEDEIFAGTELEGTHLPINITEYAHNYHTSVPGQMIQWISAIEEKKVDADIAYWNIDGNLSDSAVQANRGNGQWWLLNAYGNMTGHTVAVTPPSPNTSYTLQGVATLDEDKRQAELILGGADGASSVVFDEVPTDVFGSTVHASISEIPWTGQIGDSAQPETVAELEVDVRDGTLVFDFGGSLPSLKESSAYRIILSPGANAAGTAVAPHLWKAQYEAEDAAHTGSPRNLNGREGSPSNLWGFYTSGGYNVGGLRTGSTLKLDFAVSVPADGVYDLSLFTSTLNTYASVQEQGPTNVFVSVDGAAEQEVFLPLGYKWVVWDHADTTVELSAGDHVISVSARSIDGTRATKGDAILDRIELSLPDPDAAHAVYEAEYATLDGATVAYDRAGVSGPGAVAVAADQSAVFWVYAEDDGEARLTLDAIEAGGAIVSVNGTAIGSVDEVDERAVFLRGGVNRVEVAGAGGEAVIDRLVVTPGGDVLSSTRYEAEDATLDGSATVAPLSLASGGTAVVGVGGDPGNDNTLTFENVEVDAAGTYALTIGYSNEEQSPATHYNPDPLARHADVTVNGTTQRVWFPHSFHRNNFWKLTVPVELEAGANTIEFRSEELPNFDGETYASDTWPGVLLRSRFAPNLDWISVAPFVEPSAPALAVPVEAGSRCTASKTTLTVKVENANDVPIGVQITTPYGTKSFAAVAPRKSVAHAFSTRLGEMPAGEVSVKATATIDGAPIVLEQTAGYDARGC